MHIFRDLLSYEWLNEKSRLCIVIVMPFWHLLNLCRVFKRFSSRCRRNANSKCCSCLYHMKQFPINFCVLLKPFKLCFLRSFCQWLSLEDNGCFDTPQEEDGAGLH